MSDSPPTTATLHRRQTPPRANRTCSYGEAIHYHAQRHPDEVALITETPITKTSTGSTSTGPGLAESTVTWLELDLLANRMARAYRARGADRGDFVSIALGNEAVGVAAVIACWKIGAVPHMLPAGLPAVESRAILDLTRPALVVGDAGGVPPAMPRMSAPAKEARDYSHEPLPERDSPYCRAMCSGGSTGTPKVIVDHTEARCDPQAPMYTVQPGSITLIPGPLHHSGPFLNCFWTLLSGGRVVLMRRFDAETMLQLIERHGPSYVGLVPTMMLRVWRLPEAVRNRYDLSSLRRVVSSGAPCPAWLMQAWIDWLGPERIFEAYGASERVGGTLISGTEWLEHPGSVGKPTLGRQIRIVDDRGRPLPAGEVGQVYMKAADEGQPGFHYLGAEPEGDAEGWITLGDMGYLDAEGYLYLTDRRTDMIVSGGVNVFPAEVEAAVEAHPQVLGCAVIGLPDEDLGQRVHAIVQASGTLDETTLLAFLEERLSRHKQPRSIEFVDTPLRDDAGKLRRRRLRAERL